MQEILCLLFLNKEGALKMQLKGDLGKLEINVLMREDSETTDYWDGNWLKSEIRIHVDGFDSVYETNLRVDDLQIFYEGLISLQNGSAKEAEFTTMEEGLYLHCRVEAAGTMNCKGKANNDTGNTLSFRLQTDLAALDVFVNDLKTVLTLYPLIGDSDNKG